MSFPRRWQNITTVPGLFWWQHIPHSRRLSIDKIPTKGAPPFNNLIAISQILGDTWPDPTRVSPRSPQGAVRWQTLGTRLSLVNICPFLHFIVSWHPARIVQSGEGWWGKLDCCFYGKMTKCLQRFRQDWRSSRYVLMCNHCMRWQLNQERL